MQKKYLIGKIYGYLVCFIAIITMLMMTGSIVRGLYELKRPETSQRGYYGSGNLTSFESYKISVAKDSKLDDTQLRNAYDSELKVRNEDRIFEAKKDIVTSLMVFFVAVLFFFLHWKWIGKIQHLEEKCDNQ